MKHWTPRIAEAAGAALAAGARHRRRPRARAALLPRSRSAGTAAARRGARRPGRARLRRQLARRRRASSSVLADRIRGTAAHVVFTAHSLPARILDEGDPYRDQLLETARLVADEAGVAEWSFSYQSESPTGEPWLKPDILDHLRELTSGARPVLVCPVGFVSDHLEIRWDLDTEAQELAARARHAGRAHRDAERRPALRRRRWPGSCAARSRR